MPRKLGVGMPKRNKKKVEPVATVAAGTVAAPAIAIAKKSPPNSPKVKPAASLMRAPPPSPRAEKERLLKAAVRKAQEAVRIASKGMKHSKAALVLAYKTKRARYDSIDRAQSRKRKPLAPYKALNKMWTADVAMLEEEQMYLAGQALSCIY